MSYSEREREREGETEREKCGIGGSIPSRQGGVREARRFDSTQVLPGSGTFWSIKMGKGD